MIENLNPRSRTTEVADTGKTIGQVYDASSVKDDTHLAAEMGDLKSANEELIRAINRMKDESVLAEKDETRDDRLRAVNYLLLGFLHHPDPEIRTATEKLEAIFDNYGLKIAKESYASESALIASMIGDFSEPELAPVIGAIPGFVGALQGLAAAQSDFEQAHIAFEGSKADQGAYQNATEMKKTVTDIINKRLSVYLNAMLQVDPEKYEGFVRHVAQIVADNNQRVKNRRKKPEPPAPAPGD